MQCPWDVLLSQFRNPWRTTILFNVHEFVTKNALMNGDSALAAAFDCDFGAEVPLLRWN
jgi:hypothetical protein